MGKLESEVLAYLILHDRPITIADLVSGLNKTRSEVHKALVMLSRDKRVKFLGREYGWVAL